MLQQFDCDEVGELKEYVGCKIDWDKSAKWLKFTQPVLLQSFQDEFELLTRSEFATPADLGQVLIEDKPENNMPAEKQYQYRRVWESCFT